jgi:hypothetical protein
VALGNPGIFLRALDAAGAYGISVLFGLLPVALAIRLRCVEFKALPMRIGCWCLLCTSSHCFADQKL